MRKQLLSVLLVIVMLIGIMPINAVATDDYGEFTDGEQVISDMIAKNGMYAHPRIIMTEERFAKMKESIGDDSVTANLLEKLRNEADELLNEPVSQYEIPDGIRLLETSKRIQRRVAALAMAYNIFGEEKYAQRCYEELEAACNFKDWNPRHFLDTAEMSTAFALGYDWLYNWMDDGQRAFIKRNMIEKGLTQVMDDYEDKPRTRTYCWYQDFPGDNWKLVCNGSMSMAALAIGDEADARDIASKVLTYAYKEAYSFVRRAYSSKDGTYSEGLGYWDYATYYLGLHSSSLTSAAGTDYGLADFEGLRKSVDFVRYMSSNTPKSFSFGDDGDSRDTGWAVFLWLGDYLQSYDISSVRLKKIRSTSFNYLDLLWIDEDEKSDSVAESPTDWGEVGASNASFRNTWDESGIVAALHTGINNYKYHGHYDLGSFYIESKGARFFTDLGNENYELENRQYSYRIRAEGHNTLVINPSQKLDQQEGAECLISEFGSGNEAYAVTDLTTAYEPSDAKSVIRGLKMIKDKECVVIQDEISLNAPGEIYWFAHTKGQIDVAGDGRSAVVTVDSEKLWVGIISDCGNFTVMNAESLPTSPIVPNQTSNSSYRKLAIHLTNTKDTTISVACIPLKQGEVQPSWIPSMKEMSEWADQTPKNVVAVPEADDTVFTYNGEERTYTLAESEHYIISGNNQTSAGIYTVTVALKDKNNTVWSDGSTTDKIYRFVIRKATVTAEMFTYTPPTSLVYDGEQKTATVTTNMDGMGTITVKYSADPVNAGTYVVSVDIAEGDNYTAISDLVIGEFEILKSDKVLENTVHIYTSTVIPPSYFGQGYDLHECINCAHNYKDNFVDKLILPAISNLALKSRNYNSITLSWAENEAASGYIIQQYKNNAWVNVANIKDNATTSYQITGLAANTSYKFRAVAYVTDGESTAYSSYTSALTISTAPAQTQDFAITGRGSDYLTITWTKNEGASGYIIQEQIDGVWNNVASIKGNATTSYTIANLQPNSFHRYRMVAYKTDSNGTCYGKYTGSAPGYTAPAMVSNHAVSGIGADSLTISWDKVESADGYVIDIYRDGKWSQLAKITSNATTSYKATGLIPGTTYKFRIKSYATNGTHTIYSTYSSAISGVPTLSKVENLRMTNRGTDFISVRWDKNESADGYMVYIYDGTKWTCVKTLTTASSVSHKITGLSSGKAYKITVKAFKTVNGTKYISDTVTISANTM